MIELCVCIIYYSIYYEIHFMITVEQNHIQNRIRIVFFWRNRSGMGVSFSELLEWYHRITHDSTEVYGHTSNQQHCRVQRAIGWGRGSEVNIWVLRHERDDRPKESCHVTVCAAILARLEYLSEECLCASGQNCLSM